MLEGIHIFLQQNVDNMEFKFIFELSIIESGLPEKWAVADAGFFSQNSAST